MGKQKRFCAEIEIDGHFIKGCGTTLQEARENLINNIKADEVLFEHEKERLIEDMAYPISKRRMEDIG